MTASLLAAVVLWLGISAWHLVDLLQFFQQHEYLTGRFLRWCAGHWDRVLTPLETLPLAAFAAGMAFPAALPGSIWAFLALWLAAAGASYLRWRRARARVIKPLVFTARVKRLLAAALIAALAEAALLAWAVFGGLAFPAALGAGGLAFAALLWAFEQLTALNLVIANGVAFPVEEALRQRYISEARRIIRKVNPVVIGITGSYGKTSTKEILAHLLGARGVVLKTPKTYNTILGVCKVIREELKPQHEYFIVEMGAYKPGEIARICQLVRPKLGILTAVGPQHLERFKTIENIARAKNELIEALPADGVAIFNGDDPICRQLAAKARVKTLLYGMNPESQGLFVRGFNPAASEDGTSFEVEIAGREPEAARTQLLGRHNITNCLGAVAAAVECGLAPREAVRGLSSLEPLDHRLQAIRAPGGITTLDNAYNSNPSGAKVALEVLASFPHGRKVLVTPGFAELGPIQAQEHARLGKAAAQVCDFIFLIGDQGRREEILAGIRETGFNPERVYCYNRLNDAREQLRQLLQPGDVVLFENDLIDIY